MHDGLPTLDDLLGRVALVQADVVPDQEPAQGGHLACAGPVLETAQGSLLVTTFTSLAYVPTLEKAQKLEPGAKGGNPGLIIPAQVDPVRQ